MQGGNDFQSGTGSSNDPDPATASTDPASHVRKEKSTSSTSSVSDAFRRRPDKKFVEYSNKIAEELVRLYDFNMITDSHQLINAGRAWNCELGDTCTGIMFTTLFLDTKSDDETKVAIMKFVMSKHNVQAQK